MSAEENLAWIGEKKPEGCEYEVREEWGKKGSDGELLKLNSRTLFLACVLGTFSLYLQVLVSLFFTCRNIL